MTITPDGRNILDVMLLNPATGLPYAASGGGGGAQDGTDNTGVAQPSGGVGIRGWLSAIYNKLMSSIAVTGSVSLMDGPSVTVSLTAASILFSVDTFGTGTVCFYMGSLGSGCNIVSEYSPDNTTWTAGSVIAGGNQLYAAPINAGLTYFSQSGYRYFRVKVLVYGSGTISAIYQQRPMLVGVPTMCLQGGGAPASLSWFQKLTDGTNGPVAVRPASSAPAATDPALVVAISPNSAGVAASAMTSVSANSSTTIFSTPTAGYNRLVAEITVGITVATSITFQGSLDNVTWFNVPAIHIESTYVPPINSAAGGSVNMGAGVTYSVGCIAPYLRMTANTLSWAGTIQWLLTNAPSDHILVDQGAANGTPWAFQVSAVSAANSLSQLTAAIAPATPTVTAIKTSAGRLYLLDVGNSGASDVWVKIWNLATGSVTLGTTAALTNLYVPKGSRQTFAIADLGDFYSTAITYAVTGAISLTDNTAITTSTVTVNARYA